MKRTKLLALGIIGCLFLSGCSTEAESKTHMQRLYGENQIITESYDENMAADCTNGIFVGMQTEDVIAYKGIPYAQSPTGDLRWKDPVAPEESDTVYEAYYFGPSAIQTEWPSEVASYYPQSEDCLYLNIWKNAADTHENKAVMVFFHGGSYGWGGTSDPLYDGHDFVQAHGDVILVTVGYRTGIMGFIDFSSVAGGEEYETSGNLGLLDQVAALEWVQENITAFGGDPENVTIFGESAGGGSVSLLPLIDGTEGLFHRVIAQSGSVALTYSTEECQNLTEMLLEKSGAQNMDDLLALSEAELMELNETLNDYNNFPERDGVVLPTDLYAAYANGDAAHVDMMIGTNADETRYWIREMGYYVPGISGSLIYKIGIPMMYDMNVETISEEDRLYVQQFMELQNDKKVWNITEFYNDILFRVPAIAQAESNSANGGNVYLYYWEYPSALDELGACHATELAYVFNNLDVTVFTGDNIDPQLAETVQQMWVNFAKTGDPSTEEYSWTPYDTDTRSTMILGTDIHIEEDHLSEQRQAITPLLKYGFNGTYSSLLEKLYIEIAVVSGILISLIIVMFVLIRRRKKNKKRKEG